MGIRHKHHPALKITIILICFYLTLPTTVWGQDIYKEQGLASFYSNKFNGRLTASGEPYDCRLFTAAHRTLPVNTKVRITNLTNNRHIIVRINDRGPHTSKRILDVSEAAAEALGMIQQGLAKVELEVIGERNSIVPITPLPADSLLRNHLLPKADQI